MIEMCSQLIACSVVSIGHGVLYEMRMRYRKKGKMHVPKFCCVGMIYIANTMAAWDFIMYSGTSLIQTSFILGTSIVWKAQINYVVCSLIAVMMFWLDKSSRRGEC